MDFDPTFTEVGSGIQGELHFDQIYKRAVGAMENAVMIWDNANEPRNMIRQIANTEEEFRKDAFQEDLSYKNQLIQIFGKPYEGTIGSGKMYPAGYDGPDLTLYMYANKEVREISHKTVPLPTKSYAEFGASGGHKGVIVGGDMYDLYENGYENGAQLKGLPETMKEKFAPSFFDSDNDENIEIHDKDAYWNVNYTDIEKPKIPLVGLTDMMPVTAKGYTFEAPDSWGNRIMVGELQMIITQMIQKEAEVAEAIADWDALTGEIFRQYNVLLSKRWTGGHKRRNAVAMASTRRLWDSFKTGYEIHKTYLEATRKLTLTVADGSIEGIPKNLPTAGMSFSPGDALSMARAGLTFAKAGKTTFIDFLKASYDSLVLIGEEAMLWSEFGVGLANDDLDRAQNKREELKELEDLVGDESIKRITIYRPLGNSEINTRHSSIREGDYSMNDKHIISESLRPSSAGDTRT